MRENIKVEMTDRGLHEALGTRQFHEGRVIDPVNFWAWVSVMVFVGLFWWWVASVAATLHVANYIN